MKYTKQNTKYAKQKTKYAKQKACTQSKTPSTPKNTKYAKQNKEYAKKHQIRQKTPNMPKNTNFAKKNYALFSVLFTGLKSMVVYQKRQIWGMMTPMGKLMVW